MKAAVDTVLKPSTEHILKFHKTGLGTLNFEEISELENYTYLWNIDGDLWDMEWDMNPKGFVNETDSKDVRQQLININDLRQTALAPIRNFSENFRGSARDMAAAVWLNVWAAPPLQGRALPMYSIWRFAKQASAQYRKRSTR